MAKKSRNQADFAQWAAAIGVSVEAAKTAWADLRRRGLVAIKRGRVEVSPLALRRATSDTQRRLAAHLSGYLLTDNSYIVRHADSPPSHPYLVSSQ